MSLNVATAMQSKVVELESAMRAMPQVELRTNHYFAAGMYVREMFLPAGTVLVGKVHKREHVFMLTKGSLRVTVDNGVKDLIAPVVLIGKPGTKRAGVALEDCVCVNVHRTDKKNLAKIERELIAEESGALFDAGNQLKVIK